MRAHTLLVAWVAVALMGGCHNEEPSGSRPARTATVDEPRPAPPPTTASPPPKPKPRCVAPMGEPRPQADKASICPADPTGNLDLPKGHVTFVDAPGKPRVEVELARTPDSRERGLMYRTGMPDDGGMLFSWNDERVRTFWMHNTCIPLDMLFIDAEGAIAGVQEQVPVLNDDTRSVPCPAAHVLELNAGWVRSHGVAPGQRVKIEP